MASRKPQFTLSETPTIYFMKNRIEAVASLSPEEIRMLAPGISDLLEQFEVLGIAAGIEGEIKITIMDTDLYTGIKDEVES